jgi:NAD(P)-dependent dehydrogenase (short-subunit alcohol dehydrogenase family)
MSDAVRLGGDDPEAWVRHLETQIPLRRVGTPDDIAGVALFLATEDSAYLSGAAIGVDAGTAVQL